MGSVLGAGPQGQQASPSGSGRAPSSELGSVPGRWEEGGNEQPHPAGPTALALLAAGSVCPPLPRSWGGPGRWEDQVTLASLLQPPTTPASPAHRQLGSRSACLATPVGKAAAHTPRDQNEAELCDRSPTRRDEPCPPPGPPSPWPSGLNHGSAGMLEAQTSLACPLTFGINMQTDGLFLSPSLAQVEGVKTHPHLPPPTCIFTCPDTSGPHPPTLPSPGSQRDHRSSAGGQEKTPLHCLPQVHPAHLGDHPQSRKAPRSHPAGPISGCWSPGRKEGNVTTKKPSHLWLHFHVSSPSLPL